MNLAFLLLTLALSAFTNAAFVWKGTNQPWSKDGFGRSLTTSFHAPEWELTFSVASSLGSNLVRIWLFEGASGLVIDPQGYITGIKPQLLTNFDEILKLAKKHRVKVYPCIIPAYPGEVSFNVADFFKDTKAQEKLLENAVGPFVKRFGRRVPMIDLFNELNHWADPYFHDHMTDPESARHWVKHTINFIRQHDRNVMLTASQILANDPRVNNSIFSTTGLNFFDLHSYQDEVMLPSVSSFHLNESKPVLLGEFGEKTARGAAAQARVVKDFMRQARQGEYWGALYWMQGHKGTSQDASSRPNGQCKEAEIIATLFTCTGKPRPALQALKQG